ncbi:lysozyme inhibitor LprI family protein [Ramlibacter sp. Leaf400]|uniref:lysozyme inhibitor LprI family protein n=1 Tax=Ramlibacter sp. Leaf400 TaxID=1736365 RepID=UPI0006F7D520|nr:hypothetical protein [Ramlibacter sp. Leaf400]KQT13030.1 hypothetical protein ASG30_21680 [Ramlibacter sp. Leaf400]
MDPAIENLDLGPPPSPPILSRGLPVAVVAHVLLAVALAWGVQWKRQPDPAMAAIPLPPVTAAAPSTATMGAGPAAAVPAQPAAAAPALPPPQVVARNTVPVVPRPEPAERVSPSFDCAKARSTTERLICADPELSRQDRDLGRLFARAQAASPDPRAFRRASDAEWFRRERECRDRECLLRWYAQRREQLTAALNTEGAAR